MKQKITFLLIAAFTSVLSAQVNIQGDPYGGNPYATIQEAIVASTNPNDVVLITGVHTESISISNKSITLRGTNPATDIIQAAVSASSGGSGSRVISLSASSINPDPLPVLNITIENLGIRHGDDPENGGGINADKIIGLLTLKNLIIENNNTAKNGGGLGIAGSNTNVIECSIRNNTSTLDGGGVILAPNNGAGVDSAINIKQSLINNNTGRNGGGFYINGNNNFGNTYKINVAIENSTISNNSAFSASSGNGGGAIFSASAFWTGDGSSSNITLRLVHATVYNNFHLGDTKAGLQFAGANGDTNFSAYNSIIVGTSDDLLAKKALNFGRTNTTNVVNCILGGLNSAPLLVDDLAKNNLKGRTATESGLDIATGLQSLGGKTQVYAIKDKALFMAITADDYCSAATGITLPTIDQRGYTREGVSDAGAFEFGGYGLGANDFAESNISVKVFPNPAQDYVKISGVENVQVVKVYSLLGALEKVVYNQNEFNVSNLSSGMHMMVIESDGQKAVKRIIIE